MLPEGVVLTGGGSKTRGLTDLARTYLRLPATIGVPDTVESIAGTSMSDPIYTSVIGTLLLIQKYGATNKQSLKIPFSLGNLKKSMKNFFKKFIP